MLQERFGIGFHEAWHVRPAWEVDNLLEFVRAEQRLREQDELAAAHQAKLKERGLG